MDNSTIQKPLMPLKCFHLQFSRFENIPFQRIVLFAASAISRKALCCYCRRHSSAECFGLHSGCEKWPRVILASRASFGLHTEGWNSAHIYSVAANISAWKVPTYLRLCQATTNTTISWDHGSLEQQLLTAVFAAFLDIVAGAVYFLLQAQ